MNQLPSLPHSIPARIVWSIGFLIAIMGFAIAGYGVITFIAGIARASNAEDPGGPDMVPFIRAVTVGFPVFFVGIVVAWLATLVSPPRQEPTHSFTDSRSYNIHDVGNYLQSEGDMSVTGGVHHTVYTITNAREDVSNLSRATRTLGLGQRDNQAAGRALAAAQVELGKQKPDRSVVAKRLEEFTGILQRLGALYKAGKNVIEPLTRLAIFLGPLGKGILSVLPLL